MSEHTAGDKSVEDPQHASAPEASEDTPDLTGAVPPSGQEAQDDAEDEDRFDAG